MAALKEPVKIFIVQSLACFETPQQVADAVKQRFGLEIERQQCENYDPTKYAGRNLSKKLKDLFERTRTDFRENIEDIAIANKAFRLKELQGMYDDSGRNKRLKQNLLKQAFQETDGRVTRTITVALMCCSIIKRVRFQTQKRSRIFRPFLKMTITQQH